MESTGNNNMQSYSLYSISLRRKVIKNLSYLILLFMTLLMLIPLITILADILSKGLPVFINNPGFLTKSTGGPTTDVSQSGMANALLGSIVITFTACIIAIPVGVLAGIYLAQSESSIFSLSRLSPNLKLAFNGAFIVVMALVGIVVTELLGVLPAIIFVVLLFMVFLFINNYYTSTVRLVADVLQSTPSIVAGLVIYFFWVVPNGFAGTGAFAGGLSLSLIMLPIVARVTEEGIRTVPTSINEAALSLGIPEWRIMLTIILRSAGSIVLTGIMLGVARITGETAPLIFTTSDSNYNWGWGSATPTLTIKIYHYATSGIANWVSAGWAMAAALLIIVLGINILIRTSILDTVWKNDLLKMMFYELIVIGLMISVLTLFGNVVLILALGIFLRFYLLNILSNREILHKIVDFKVASIPAGIIIIIVYVLEMVAEIGLFLLDISVNYLYQINLRLFQLFLVIGGIYYLYSVIKQNPEIQRIIKLITGFVFLLILIEVAKFDFGGNNYFIGDVVYFMLLVSILFRLFFYNIVAGSKHYRELLWSKAGTRYFIVLEFIEVGAQILFIAIYLFLNNVLHLNIYLYENYIYVINFNLTIGLIIALVLYFGILFFKNRPSNASRAQFILLLFIILFSINYIIPLGNELLSQILFGLIIKSLIVFIVLKNPLFSSVRKTVYAKSLLVLVILESLFEFILFLVNTSVGFMTSFVFNLNYALVIIVAIYLIYSLLDHYNFINVNTHV